MPALQHEETVTLWFSFPDDFETSVKINQSNKQTKTKTYLNSPNFHWLRTKIPVLFLKVVESLEQIYYRVTF